MKSIFTARAQRTYRKNVDYLQENWTQKEVDKFVQDTKKTIELIEKQPYTFEASDKDKNIRKGNINKYIKLIYRILPRKKLIQFLLFWHNSQDPKKLKY